MAEHCEFGGIDGYYWKVWDNYEDAPVGNVWSAANARLIVKALNSINKEI